jgi:hypothetical protein
VPASRPTADVTTYRYVRGALIALVGALAVAVVEQAGREGWQWRPSISAYYYSPVGPVLVAAIVGIGVLLIALRGRTEAEDVVLNVAGLSAPMIAFVPTPWGQPPDATQVSENVTAYLAVLGAGALAALLIGRLQPGGAWPTPWGWAGYAAVLGSWAAGVLWLALDRDSLAAHGHAVAASATFGCFALAVLLNTAPGRRWLPGVGTGDRSRFDAPYLAIVIAMAAGTLAYVVASAVGARDDLLLDEEIVLLASFVVFWALQTVELWSSPDQ